MAKEPHILVAPLNWGLGHATRCIPIIRALTEKNVRVSIAAEEHPKALLEKEFPDLDFFDLPGYQITYPSGGNMAIHMVKLMPKILKGISEERKALEKLIKEKNIDGVISDNRFGLHTNLVPTVFITHQVMIKSAFAESIIQKLNRRFISKFDTCWIPDYEGDPNLSGDLSHRYEKPKGARFIGPLTRFSRSEPKEVDIEVLAIISGPEPQRTLFQHIVQTELEISNLKSVMVIGKAEQPQHLKLENIEVRSHATATELEDLINRSKYLVTRSGYSTLMDLAAMGRSAIMIPTPGQTEQEYLAQYHMDRKHYFAIDQDRFDLEEAIKFSTDFEGVFLPPTPDKMNRAIEEFLGIIRD